MIIFVNEDRAYLAWLTHHRQSFVVDALRKPSRRRPVVHRAICPAIRSAPSGRTHWTTGRKIKLCSSDLSELTTWCTEMVGSAPKCCEQCRPDMQDPPWPATGDADQSAADRLPHFASEVLDYVLEIAVIFLDGGTEVYQLTVEDIAKTFKKSSTQLAATLTRLADDGFLASDVTPLPAKVAGKEMLFPTERALRTLPAFAGMTKLALTRELDKLHDG